MKKLLLLLTLTLTVSAFTCNGSPRIQFEQETHNFGKVPQKSVFKHVFKFRNTGNDTLIIKETKATCGCTSTILSDKRIPSGDPGEIEVTFRSGYYEGKVTRAVFVYSNDTSRKYVRLTIKAEVQEAK